MYLQKRENLIKKALLFLPVLLVLPFVIAFDSLTYFITRPSCLSCGNLVEFLKSASLTTFLISGIAGYKLKKEKTK